MAKRFYPHIFCDNPEHPCYNSYNCGRCYHKWRAKNDPHYLKDRADKQRERISKMKLENPTLWKERHRRHSRKANYGITQAEYDNILRLQHDRCAICGKLDNGERELCVDHDHNTGRIRGLLCLKCNLGVGYFLDNAFLMREAADYIFHKGEI